MPQRSRLSPESTPEEIRAARIEDARRVPSRSPEQDAPRSRRAALLRGAGGVQALCRGHARNPTLRVRGFAHERSPPITLWFHEMELIN